MEKYILVLTSCVFSPLLPFQDTGPMLHFANGKPVEGVEATLSDTIHVHAVCIEWYAIMPFLLSMFR
jgi:hypothetical protein